MTQDAIRPGQVWLDVDGKRIQAHGGSIFIENGVFTWYGENKEKTTAGSGNWHWGVRAYTSTDLLNWEDKGLIIPPVLDDQDSPLHPRQMMDRPHIILNERTGKYVCWLKIMGKEDADTQASTVLVADSLLGPYDIVRTGLRPLGTLGTREPVGGAAKGAVRILTKTAALRWAKRGIRVNSVHPGFIDTLLHPESACEPSRSGKFHQAILDVTPLGRLGRPEEVAAGVAYLASDEAAFVTGSELYIDGGYMAR